MATLVERAREVIAAEDDDYFLDDTILYYLNKGQSLVVAYMINFEDRNDVSLRALDELRKVSTLTPSSGTAKDTYYETDVDFPSDLNDFQTLVYNKNTLLQEIPQKSLYLLEFGNLNPSVKESYFYITHNGTKPVFRLYLYENPDGTTDSLEVYYTKNPTDAVLVDTAFTEIPDQLENAVIYAAASMMASQELNEGTEFYINKYKEELNANIY